MPHTSIPAVFREQVAKLKARPMVYGKRDRHWRPLTWAQMGDRVMHAAAGLVAVGLQPGEVVGILAQSGPEWVLADLAALSAGAMDAPVYDTSPADVAGFILADCAAAVVVVDTLAQLDKVRAVRDRLPALRVLIYTDERLKPDRMAGVRLMSLLDLEQIGADTGVAGREAVDARVGMLGPDVPMTLIYTSGTTGDPKGVVLTHGNMLADCEATGRAVPVGTDDILLSFLPLAHAFERMAAYYMASLFSGATLYFSDGMSRLFREMAEVSPTLMTGVPRVYEKLYARVMARRAAGSLPERVAMDWALAVGRRVARAYQTGKTPGRLLRTQHELAREQVFGDLRTRLGGRLRFMVSGGAPLSAEVAEFFFAAGILILEGYGLSETSPVVSVNRLDAFRFGTVGKPLDNVRLRFAPDGEILVKGPNVMLGYHPVAPVGVGGARPPVLATDGSAVLGADGWLATGDLGALDADGYLVITGRKKDLFKTATGKYVAPQRLEHLLTGSALIDQAVVVGDRRPFCVALLVPTFPALEAWAAEEGLAARSPAALVSEPKVVARVREEVERINLGLARHEAIRQFALLDEPFTEAEGLMTPSHKIRRERITEACAARIEALYQEPRLRR